MDSQIAPGRGTWVSANGNVGVEYTQCVLEEIRAAAVAGMCRFPRGGVEVGGLLLGSYDGGTVRVTGSAPVECSYVNGPAFAPTPAEEDAIRRAAAEAREAVVGWWHSHTRSALELTAEDAALHARLFGKPWHVALVLRPEPFGTAEAVFFTPAGSGCRELAPPGSVLFLRPADDSNAAAASRRRARSNRELPAAREESREAGRAAPPGTGAPSSSGRMARRRAELLLRTEELPFGDLVADVGRFAAGGSAQGAGRAAQGESPAESETAYLPAAEPGTGQPPAPALAASLMAGFVQVSEPRAAAGVSLPRAILPLAAIPEPAPPSMPNIRALPPFGQNSAEPGHVSEEAPVPAAVFPPSRAVEEVRKPAALPRPAAPAKRRKRFWAATAAASVLLTSGAIWMGARPEHTPANAPHLHLRVSETGGQLRITWDRNSEPMRLARGGAILIRDSGRDITVPFDAGRIRAGTLTYARTGRDVEIRLRVDGPVPAEESVRLFGPPVNPVPAAPSGVQAPAQDAAPPAAPDPAGERGIELAGNGPEGAPADRQIRTDEPEQQPARTAREAVPARPFRPVPLQPVQNAAALPAPPPVQSTPQFGGPLPEPRLPSAAPPQAQLLSQREPLREDPRQAAHTGPSAGRLIWVGRLPRGASLTIEGQRASSGVLTGELPGVPVRISAYPARLSEGELQVFASSPAVRGIREPPGPQNGWNPTVYAWDERRSADVIVTETPSAQNGWKALSLRGNGAPVSVVVIDWRVAQ